MRFIAALLLVTIALAAAAFLVGIAMGWTNVCHL